MDNTFLQDANLSPKVIDVRAQPMFGLRVETAGSPGRAALEKQIAARFASQFDARIQQFLPYLLTLEIGGRSSAVAGLRPGATGALFLERYLDNAAEQVISRTFHMPVDRSQVVEIGNLASSEAGSGYILFAVLAALLSEAGFRWVICTATPQVENMLRRMGFTPTRICVADPTRLGDAARDWGSYYSVRPHVIAGDVRHAAERVQDDANIAAILRDLGDISERLETYRRQS